MNENIRTVEINGVKFEVDLRHARKIDTFKVGDNVKILKHGDGNYSKDEVLPGMVVDFADFKELPTMVVAYYKEGGWSEPPSIDFLYFNSNLEGYDIVYCDENEVKCSGESILQKFDHKITDAQRKLDDLIAKKEYFITHFMPEKDSNE